MKHLTLICALLLTVCAHAQGSEEPISFARGFELSKMLFENAQVQPYLELAQKMSSTSAKDSAMPAQTRIHCDHRPMSYGTDLAKGYCEIKSYLFYGWHSDSVMYVVVTGYIRKEKIQSGPVEIQQVSKGGSRMAVPAFLEKDLFITSVEVATPLYTGLE